MMKGHGRLILPAAEQGRYELQSNKLKPLDGNKVVDSSRVSVEEVNFSKPLPPAAPGTASTNSAAKTVGTLRPSQDETAPVNEVTLSDSRADTGSQTSLGDAARAARQRKTATDNPTTQPSIEEFEPSQSKGGSC